MSPDGYILTNNQVVEKATEIKVVLSDKREFTGKVVGIDPKTDFSLIKISATGLPTLTLGDSSKMEVGDYRRLRKRRSLINSKKVRLNRQATTTTKALTNAGLRRITN